MNFQNAPFVYKINMRYNLPYYDYELQHIKYAVYEILVYFSIFFLVCPILEFLKKKKK